MKQQSPNKTLTTLRLIAILLVIVIFQLGVLTALQVSNSTRIPIPSTLTGVLFEWEIDDTSTAAFAARWDEMSTQDYIERSTMAVENRTIIPFTLTALDLTVSAMPTATNTPIRN